MRFARHVKWRGERFGAVVFDTLNEKVYVANAAGRDILSLLEKGLDTPTVAERLKEKFEGDEAQIRSDTAAFLLAMQSAGLLTSNPGSET